MLVYKHIISELVYETNIYGPRLLTVGRQAKSTGVYTTLARRWRVPWIQPADFTGECRGIKKKKAQRFFWLVNDDELMMFNDGYIMVNNG